MVMKTAVELQPTSQNADRHPKPSGYWQECQATGSMNWAAKLLDDVPENA
jgi:hypothetical protein